MTDPNPDVDLNVTVAKDLSEASLTIPGDFPREHLSLNYCLRALEDRSVEINDHVRQATRELVDAARERSDEVGGVVARITPPTHGKDGYVHWFLEDPPEQTEPDPEPSEDHAINYYELSAFAMVKADQVIGYITPPTKETDGRNVVGGVIAAKPGRPAELKLDDTIVQKPDGSLVAVINGVVQREPTSAKISAFLKVPGHVDFSTGNIDFDGDLVIDQGVRDRFLVKAARSLHIRGLVEAAMIECGGDFIASGGMAGREAGTLKVGGNVVARYLDGVSGKVGGDLQVDNEVMNCQLVVGGAVKMPRGSIIGGSIHITGDARVAVLGAAVGTPTHVVLGSVPVLEDKLRELTSMCNKLRLAHEQLAEDHQQLVSRQGALTAQEREHITEMIYEMEQAQSKCQRAEDTRKRLQEEIEKRRAVKFEVLNQISEKVHLTIMGNGYKITDCQKGPISIGLDDQKEPVYRVGNGPALPLTAIAQPAPSARQVA